MNTAQANRADFEECNESEATACWCEDCEKYAEVEHFLWFGRTHNVVYLKAMEAKCQS